MSFIYVIGYLNNAGPYKVGVAADPRRRAIELQTGNPEPLTIRRTFEHDDALGVERVAHDLLAVHRLTGEWFNAPLEKVIDCIECAMAEEKPLAEAKHRSLANLIERIALDYLRAQGAK